MTGNTRTTRHVNLAGNSVINMGGWICGGDGELLIWIPPLHRTGLYRSSTIWIAGKHVTHLNLSTFVHGQSWTTCMDA